MGAGSSTEQRSPEQPEEGITTPSEPQPGGDGGGGGGPATEAAPGAPGDPAIAAADPATKVRARRTTCPREAGGGGFPLISACENFPARAAHLQTQEHEPLSPGLLIGLIDFAPGWRPEQQRARRGARIFVVWVSGGGDCAIRSHKSLPVRAANRAFLHTLPVGATQPETHGLQGGGRGEVTPGPSVLSLRPRFLPDEDLRLLGRARPVL